MPKFHGKIGFVETKESDTSPGVWEEVIVERNFYGELTKNSRRWEGTSVMNEDLNISNEISILSNSYIMQNAGKIRYVVMLGSKWKVTNITIEYPRLTLTIGGLYNG